MIKVATFILAACTLLFAADASNAATEIRHQRFSSQSLRSFTSPGISKTISLLKVKMTTTSSVTPEPTHSPSPSPQLNYQSKIMQAINAYRKSYGLTAVKTDSYTCDFAKIRAREIVTDFSHTGFQSRIAAQQLPYPSYTQVTENIAKADTYAEVVPLWINSSGHAENMRKDTPYVCVEQFGDYFAYAGWQP